MCTRMRTCLVGAPLPSPCQRFKVTLLGPIFSYTRSPTAVSKSTLQRRLDDGNTNDITRFWIADETQASASLPKTLVPAKL